MEITLPADLEQFVQQQIAGGEYTSPGEIVRDALYLLQDRERLREWKRQELRKEVLLGIADSDAGRVAPLDLRAIRERGRQMLAAAEAERSQAAG